MMKKEDHPGYDNNSLMGRLSKRNEKLTGELQKMTTVCQGLRTKNVDGENKVKRLEKKNRDLEEELRNAIRYQDKTKTEFERSLDFENRKHSSHLASFKAKAESKDYRTKTLCESKLTLEQRNQQLQRDLEGEKRQKKRTLEEKEQARRMERSYLKLLKQIQASDQFKQKSKSRVLTEKSENTTEIEAQTALSFDDITSNLRCLQEESENKSLEIEKLKAERGQHQKNEEVLNENLFKEKKSVENLEQQILQTQSEHFDSLLKLTQQKDEVSKLLEESDNKCKDCEKALEKKCLETDHLQRSIDANLKNLVLKQKEIEDKILENNETRKLLMETNVKNDFHVSENHKLQNLASSLKTSLDNVQNDKKRAEEKIAKIESELSNTKLSCNNEITTLREQVASQDKNLSCLKKNIVFLENQKEQLEEEKRVLFENADQDNTQIAELEDNIRTLNIKLKEEENNYDVLNEMFDTFKIEKEVSDNEQRNRLDEVIKENEHVSSKLNENYQCAMSEKAKIEEELKLRNQSIKDYQVSSDKMDQAIQSLNLEYDALKKHCEKLETSLSDLRSEKEKTELKMDEKLKISEKEIQSLRSIVETNKKEMRNLEQQLETVEEENLSRKQLIDQFEANVASLEDQVCDYDLGNEELRSKLDELKKENKSSLQALEQSQKKKDAEIETYRVKLETSLSDYSQLKKELTQQRDETQKHLQEKKEQNLELQAELEKTLSDLSTLNQEKKKEHNLNQKLLQEKKDQLLELNSELEGKILELSTLKRETLQEQERHEEKKIEISDLRDLLKKAHVERDQLEEKMIQLNQEYLLLQKKGDESTDAFQKSEKDLERTVTELNETINSNRQQWELQKIELDANVKEKTQQISDLRDNISAITKDLEKANHDIDHLERKVLQNVQQDKENCQKISDLTEAFDQKTNKLKCLEEQLATLTTERDRAQYQIQELNESIHVQNRERETLRQENHQNDVIIQEKQNYIIDLQHQHDALVLELETSKIKFEEQLLENDHLLQNVREDQSVVLETLNVSLAETRNQLNKEISEKKSKEEQFQKAIEEKTKENDQIKDTLEESKRKFEEKLTQLQEKLNFESQATREMVEEKENAIRAKTQDIYELNEKVKVNLETQSTLENFISTLKLQVENETQEKEKNLEMKQKLEVKIQEEHQEKEKISATNGILEKELKQKMEENLVLGDQLKERIQENELLHDNLASLQNHLKKEKENIGHLQSTINQFRKQYEAENQKNQEIQKTMAQEKQKNLEISTKITEMNQKWQQEKLNFSETTQNLETQIQVLRDELLVLDTERKRLSNQNLDYETALQQKHAKASDLQTQLDHVEEKIDAHQLHIETLESEKSQLQRDMLKKEQDFQLKIKQDQMSFQRNIDSVKRENEIAMQVLQDKVEKLKKENAGWKTSKSNKNGKELETLNEKLENLRRESAKLNILQLTEDFDEQVRENDRLREDIEILKQRVETLEIEINSLNEKTVWYENKVNECTQDDKETSGLAKKPKRSTEILKSLSFENTKLKKEIKEMQRKIEKMEDQK